MPTITWNHPCYFCHRPITRGRPTLVFSTERQELVGLSHFTCCATKYRYGHYQMHPPRHLSSERASFLVQFYPMLYSLPGGFNIQNSDLKSCVADTLWDYPKSLINPLDTLRKFRKQNVGLLQPYQGDLETDYLMFLAKVQKAAKENPSRILFYYFP